MGKLKTKRGAMKRFKFTKKKKIKFHPGGKSHLASCKKTKRIRSLRRGATLDNPTEAKYFKRMLPYG
jgi:large subunit ribosomal protein L35